MAHRNYRIVNSVISTGFNESIDLEKQAACLRGAQYEPESFSGLVLRRPNLRTTLVLFATGRFVAISRLPSIGVSAMKIVSCEMSTVQEQHLTFRKPVVVNMVAAADLGSRVDIEKLCSSLSRCTYDPEQFPGLIYHFDERIVLLIFASGKVNCVGARGRGQVEEALRWLDAKIESTKGDW